MKFSLCTSDFLEEIADLSHSFVFLYFFALITEEGFCISPCSSLELYIQMGISFLSPLLFASVLFSAICKASSDNHFAFCISFSWGWSWSQPPIQCHERKKMKSLSHVPLFATPWTVAHQAPPSMELSRQEYWSGLPFPSTGDLPYPGIEPRSPALHADSLLSEPLGNPTMSWTTDCNFSGTLSIRSNPVTLFLTSIV